MHFMKLALSFALLATAAPSLSVAAVAQSTTSLPGMVDQKIGDYAFMIGRVRITSLSDGTVPQDLHTLLHGAPVAEIDALLQRSYLANPIELSLNAFLVQTGNRTILVDTGVGQLYGPGYGGKMLASLAAAGVSPEQVTDVLLTHLHDDHMGGLVKDGQLVFANATIHVGKPDLDFFMDPSNAAKAHYDKKYFDEAVKCIKPYSDAGKVQTFNETTEIVPGITASLHPGHTPGSAFYTVESGGQKLVFVGDIVHVASVQFPNPKVTIDYDVNQTNAEHARQEDFAQFSRDRTLIAIPHVPFPAVGHVRQVGSGYEWVPVEYGNRSTK